MGEPEQEGLEQRVADLADAAERSLDAREFERALELAGELLALGHTSGFEFKARALCGLDRVPEACSVLEEGVALAPSVAPLWSCLGELRSDLGRYAAAREAFRRAGEIDAQLLPQGRFNEAVVLMREERPQEALALLDRVGAEPDSELEWAVFELLRELRGLDARHARALELLCEGRVRLRFERDNLEASATEPGECGYFARFRVLAEDAAEALVFAEELERRTLGEGFCSLRIVRASAAADGANGCRGVYWRGGRTFFTDRDGAG